jgi:hypothetical protein
VLCKILHAVRNVCLPAFPCVVSDADESRAHSKAGVKWLVPAAFAASWMVVMAAWMEFVSSTVCADLSKRSAGEMCPIVVLHLVLLT